MGSLIALEAAGRAPERVTRLVMLGSCYPMAVPKALLDLSLSAPLKAIDRVVMFSHSTLAAKPSYPARLSDPTGMGSAFCGGCLAGYQKTFHPLDAVLRGSISASLKVEGSGPFYPMGVLPGLTEARLQALTEMVRKI